MTALGATTMVGCVPERPSFDKALAYWHEQLESLGHSIPTRWLFRENLCLQSMPREGADFRIAYSTEGQRCKDGTARRLYEYACQRREFLAFFAVSVAPGQTFSTFLNDSFSVDELTTVDEWDLHFCADEPFTFFEEIVDEAQWAVAKKRENNSMSPLDFVYVSDTSRYTYWRNWVVRSLGLRP